MARKSPLDLFSGKSGGGSMMKKVLVAVVVIAVIAMVLKAPGESAQVVNDARDNGETVIDRVITFLQGLRIG